MENEYKEYIKETVEDELAEACLRLLSLGGLRGIDLSEKEETICFAASEEQTDCDMTFTECMFTNIANAYGRRAQDVSLAINDILTAVICDAVMMGIDIYWHIEQKMRYNEKRPAMHGKKY